MILLSLKMPENFIRLILLDGFCFELMAFSQIINLLPFTVDHLSYSVLSSTHLVLFICLVAASTIYVIQNLRLHIIYICYCVAFYLFNIIGLYGVILCSDFQQFSFFPFLIHSHVLVSLCAISSVCHLKYPYSCFYSHFCFLFFFFLFSSLYLYFQCCYWLL